MVAIDVTILVSNCQDVWHTGAKGEHGPSGGARLVAISDRGYLSSAEPELARTALLDAKNVDAVLRNLESRPEPACAVP